MKFKQFINETIINVIKPTQKEKYVDIVWDILQESYKSIGGIKGSGFASKTEMINKIKLWKLVKSNNKIVAIALYKDRNSMRKTVAIGTDGSAEGKKELLKLLKEDVKRSSIEISHSLLKFIQRNLPELITKYGIESSKVQELLNKDIEIIDKYQYKRNINGTEITKIMLGTKVQFY